MKKKKKTQEIHLELPSSAIKYYRHGWQSWSLTTWQGVNQRVPTPKPKILHPLQTDPRYVHETRPHGSWVGVVEMENGNYLLLGALSLDAHIFLEKNTLIGKYENEAGDWFIAEGSKKEVFEQYANALKKVLGVFKTPSNSPPPKIWCSWYSL